MYLHTSVIQGPFRFTYISPVNRLRAMFENPVLREKLNYPINRKRDESELGDVFDGEHYKTLRDKNVAWEGEVVTPPSRYFADSTDIALGFSTDGVPLHTRTGLDAWPLVLTVYSLPPEVRYKQEYQICCGLVPGKSAYAFKRPVHLVARAFIQVPNTTRRAA